MIRLPVDGSLEFVFEDGWLAEKWDEAPARTSRAVPGRKAVDIAAVRDRALLIEVKDDRAKSLESARERRLSARDGTFFDGIALKMRHSIEDLLDSEQEDEVSRRFAKVWREERRRLVLWWERGPYPPDGEGTFNQRWQVHLSALSAVLKQQVAGLGAQTLVRSRPFADGPDDGVTVRDIPEGVARRRGR